MERKINSARQEVIEWFRAHFAGLGIYNILLMLMVLLRSAGYFQPFFLLTINTIVFLAMILSIFLLDFRTRALFLTASVFLAISAVFRLFSIDIWAERASIYMYQALFLGTIMIFFEIFKKVRKL